VPTLAIPSHLKSPDVYAEQLRQLNEIAIRDGWRSSLSQVFISDPGMIQYVTDPKRCNFLGYLPLAPQSTVLEIGPGLGQITTSLASRVGFVHALEIDAGQVEFISHRCQQEGATNVAVVCGGHDCRLPYESSTFDGVLINNVLEWCGWRNPSGNFLESQRLLLTESYRVLRPGGWLYLMTKNRFGWRYLLGKPDEHTYHWRFGQAMPRWLLALLLRLCGKSQPKGLIHSYRALRRMLSEAGFSDLQPFWAVPDFRCPTELIPADADSIRAARRRPGFVQGDMRSARLLVPLLPARLIKYVTPGLIFLAQKRTAI
jgi:SAM-dependent methyltransferase